MSKYMMNEVRNQIIATAYDWLDTPYHHHALVKGVGVDCAKLVAACALGAGLTDEDTVNTMPNYPVQWHLHNREEKLLETIEAYGCVRKDKANTLPGDIVTFQFGRTTSHLGIMVNETQFIHARYDIGKVVLNDFNDDWMNRWTFTYLLPGVIDG